MGRLRVVRHDGTDGTGWHIGHIIHRPDFLYAAPHLVQTPAIASEPPFAIRYSQIRHSSQTLSPKRLENREARRLRATA